MDIIVYRAVVCGLNLDKERAILHDEWHETKEKAEKSIVEFFDDEYPTEAEKKYIEPVRWVREYKATVQHSADMARFLNGMQLWAS